MNKNYELKFCLNYTSKMFEELKKYINKKHSIILEINLLPQENRDYFAKLHAELQNKFPNKFPITIKLNEKLKNEAIIYLE